MKSTPPPDPHTLGLESWHFIKASRSIANPGATIKISHYSKKMDWEVELAAVIGKAAKDVPVEKALAFETALRAYLKSKYAALMASLEKTKDLSADDEKALIAAVEDFKKNGAY